jgi:peptidyl-prolyl cis-trans isomerase D
MAIIGKIRERSGLLLIIMAVTLLLFILSDALTNFRGTGEEMTIASIFEEPLTPKEMDEYNLRAEKRINDQNMTRQQQGQPALDEISIDQTREQVWNEFINEKIYEHELLALGMVEKVGDNVNYLVSPDELNALFFTQGAHYFVKQIPIFQDSVTKQFRPELVKRFRANEVEKNQYSRQQWTALEQEVKKQVVRDKYNAMIKNGIYITKAEAKRDYDANNRKYKIKLVAARIDQISDSAVKVNETDIKNTFNKLKNRKQYENTYGSTKFEYIQFPITPSDADVKYVREDLENLKESFQKSEDDSSFIVTYSATKNTNPQMGMSYMYPEDIDSLIQLSDSNDVIGPFEDPMSKQMGKTGFKMIKIKGFAGTQKEVKARHILLKKEEGDSKTLLARADSIKKVIKANGNFTEMVAEYSGDLGSVPQGGGLGWFTEGMMVTEFNDACFKGKVGDMPIVETQFGVHLIEILGSRDGKKPLILSVDVQVEAGDETVLIAREKAQEFFDKVEDAKAFTKLAQKEGFQMMEKELQEKAKFIDQNPSSRELSRRIHDGSLGEITEPIVWGDNVVICHIKHIRKEGTPDLEDVRVIMESEARREKKLDLVAKQIKGSKSLADAAQRANTNVMDMEVTFASNALPGLGGAEMEVIGTVFSFGKKDIGKVSVPVRGKNGIYMFQLESIVEAPATKDYKANKQTLEAELRSRAILSGEAFLALKKKANVVDNRQLY